MTAAMREEPQRQTTQVYQAAVYYASLGWHVIPLYPRTKKAALQWRNGEVNYQTTKPDASELQTWFNDWIIDGKQYKEQPNIAVILRDETVQLDFDGVEDQGGLVEWGLVHPDVLRLPRVRTGSGKAHVFFGLTTPIQHYDIELRSGGVIEVRTGRNIAVLPPSIHPNRQPYIWDIFPGEDGLPVIDPATVGVKARPKLTVVTREYHEGDPLTATEIDTIVAAFAPYWNPDDGKRHKLSQAIPGWLASIGAPEEDARTVITRLMSLPR